MESVRLGRLLRNPFLRFLTALLCNVFLCLLTEYASMVCLAWRYRRRMGLEVGGSRDLTTMLSVWDL
jgi:hypothetical protein